MDQLPFCHQGSADTLKLLIRSAPLHSSSLGNLYHPLLSVALELPTDSSLQAGAETSSEHVLELDSHEFSWVFPSSLSFPITAWLPPADQGVHELREGWSRGGCKTSLSCTETWHTDSAQQSHFLCLPNHHFTENAIMFCLHTHLLRAGVLHCMFLG